MAFLEKSSEITRHARFGRKQGVRERRFVKRFTIGAFDRMTFNFPLRVHSYINSGLDDPNNGRTLERGEISVLAQVMSLLSLMSLYNGKESPMVKQFSKNLLWLI